MNEEPSQSNRPGNQKNPAIWLLCAFVPSLVAIPCWGLKSPVPALVPLLVILNIVCSLTAGIKLLGRTKAQDLRIALGFLLGVFFFVMNVVVVVFVGCSGMSRIAP
jgi:hypothetical protein